MKNQLMTEFERECKKFANAYKVAKKATKALKRMNFLCKLHSCIARAEYLKNRCSSYYYYDRDDNEFKFRNDLNLSFPLNSTTMINLDNAHRFLTSVIQFLVLNECRDEHVVKIGLWN